jgi:hypothetical protein
MLHDAMISGERSASIASERRESYRANCTVEVTIAWQDHPSVPCRYAAGDLSDGGLRIRSALPMLEGTVGRALRMLPTGREIDRPVMVIWSQRDDETGRYDIGLRYF